MGDQVWVYQNGFWHNYHARNFHENHENLSKEVETKMFTNIHIFGRHIDSGTHPYNAPKASQSCGGGFVRSRIQIESQKKQIATKSVGRTFGFSNQFSTRKIANNPPKR